MARGRAGYGGRSGTSNRRQAPEDEAQTSIDVVVERIFWQATDSDYKIVSSIDHATGREVILKGHIDAAEGERVRVAEGKWKFDSRYGWSFQVKKIDRSDPVDPGELAAYLCSLEAVSPRLADAIIAALGTDCLSKIDANPDIIRGITGGAPGEADSLADRWLELRGRRLALTYLASLDLSDALAQRIIRFYGAAEAVAVVRDDPYKITEVPRVSFRLADRIARTAGVALDDPKRLAAGTEYVLAESEDDGHSYMERGDLIHRCYGVLGIPPRVSIREMNEAIDAMLREQRLVSETVGSQERIYTAEMFRIETSIYEQLQSRLQMPPTGRTAPRRPVAPAGGFAPTDEQWNAVEAACTERISLMTGGPGVGKTATLATMVETLEREGITYALAAPTGKAAKRMSESTGRKASTLHRLIGWAQLENTDLDAETTLIKADTIIIDESSMLSMRMAERVLAHCGPQTNIVLVGDPDQLPPVGAGSVFLDLLESDRVPTSRLTKVFRQAEDSLLLLNARRIRAGHEPYWTAAEAEAAVGHPVRADWTFIETADTKAAAAEIVRQAQLHPSADTLLVSPTKDGEAGVHALNERMQQLRNPSGESIGRHEGRELRVGDTILITQNDSRLDVVNGDIGQITSYDAAGRTVEVELDDGDRVMSPQQLLEISQLGYTITVHKSQGSQAPHLVSSLTEGTGERMLSRALIYTAWTRAQQSCTVIGSRAALRTALGNDGSQRNTTLDLRVASIARRLEIRARTIRTMRDTMVARRKAEPAPIATATPARPVPRRTMPDEVGAAARPRATFRTPRRP